MPLTNLEVSAKVGWTLKKPNTGRVSTVQGPDSIEKTAKPLVATYDQVYEAQLSFTAGEVKEVDIRTFTNRAGEAVVLTKALGIILAPVGSTVAVATGTTNGLAWRAETVEDGGVSLFYQPVPKVIDATHKTIKLTSGPAPMTLDIAVIGGTT
jgi:hypothetical protein